ncbi:hypothetical protein V8F33_007927 [Rhypophila sp. PSN 637]
MIQAAALDHTPPDLAQPTDKISLSDSSLRAEMRMHPADIIEEWVEEEYPSSVSASSSTPTLLPAAPGDIMTTSMEKIGPQNEPGTQVPGKFWEPCDTHSKEEYSHHKPWKYQLTSFHFPPNHHYQHGGAKTPWIARIDINFNNLDNFKNHQFSWRHDVEGCSWWDKFDLDVQAHPVVDDVVMYFREVELLWAGDDDSEPLHGEAQRNDWSVNIKLWARDLRWLEGELTESKIASLISQDTRVWWIGRVRDNNNWNLSPVHVFYDKTFESRPSPHLQDHEEKGEELQQTLFCLHGGGAKPGIDEPDLRQAVDDHFARQLFGHQ